jgi:hypothetical protein
MSGKWDRPLARLVRTPGGQSLRTLGGAGLFVSEQDALRKHWRVAAQALMIASVMPAAIEDATASVERALLADRPERSPRR